VRSHDLRLIIFDLDGTLVDSRRDLAQSANDLLAECGCPTQAEDALGRMIGEGAAVLVARAFAAARCDAPPDALPRFLAIYERRLLESTRPYPGMVDVLTDLGGRYPLAILTNKPRASTMRILDGLDLARHFSSPRVIGGDGPWPRKPDPAGLNFLCSSVAVEPAKTMLVGDSVIDWRTARAAGAQVCLAEYGFGFDGFPTDVLSAGDYRIGSPVELLAIL
jgi:phosphoglycolate phosphatase